MDWKREAADKLKCYEAKRTSMERAREEMRRLEDDMTRVSRQNDPGEPAEPEGYQDGDWDRHMDELAKKLGYERTVKNHEGKAESENPA